MVRRFLGGPGSIRRWLVGTLIAVPLSLATFNLYVIVAVVLFSVMWIMYLRTTLVDGDEDELRAWLKWQRSRKNPDRFTPGEPTEATSDPAEWFNRRPNTFLDVPPPPIAEEDDGA